MTDSALIAAWVEASATVVAVGAAVYAGYYAKRAFEVEVKRDAERDEDRRRAQAEKVSAWLGALPEGRYFILNASESPAYGLDVDFRLLGTDVSARETYDVLPPGKTVVATFPTSFLAESRRVDTNRFPVHFEVTFRDAAGRLFSRSSDGTLVHYRHVGDPQRERQEEADRTDPHC